MLPLWALSQESNQDAHEITRIALYSGSSSELSNLYNRNFELILFGSSYDYQNATTALKEFFSEHPSTEFDILHTGSSEDKSISYAIGKYKSEKGEFRVLMRFKNNGEKQELHKLEFSHQ